MGKLLPFRWYGGKYSHLDFLLDKLPRTHEYVEPFGGSAAVLLNRDPAPVETYNDLDSDLVAFFRVLRENPEELIDRLRATPFSREVFAEAVEKQGDDSVSDVERARLFMVRAGQVRSGLAQDATPGRWAYHKTTSRRDMAGGVSRWWGKIENLEQVANRLRRVQIEHLPATDVVEKYDSPDCLFYCDPPYPHGARSDDKPYRYEMSDEEHRDLAAVLNDAEGYVAVSGYKCPLMEELYGDWHRYDAEVKQAHVNKEDRQEALWTNYDVEEGVGASGPGQKTFDEFSERE